MPFLAKPECLCLLDFVCNQCLAKEEAAKVDPLAGYGYDRADQDGYDGGSVSPEEHKAEEFESAIRLTLDAREL